MNLTNIVTENIEELDVDYNGKINVVFGSLEARRHCNGINYASRFERRMLKKPNNGKRTQEKVSREEIFHALGIIEE